MDSFSDVIQAFGGTTRYGHAVGIPDSHARTMKARDSIPLSYWTKTVEAAKAREIEGITLESLAAIAARKRKPAPERQAAEVSQ